MNPAPPAHTTAASPSPSPLAAPDLPAAFARTRRFSLGVPGRFAVSPDGARVLFTRTASGTDPVGRLWLSEECGERLLADPLALGGPGDDDLPEEEKVRRERSRVLASGITGYATDAAGPHPAGKRRRAPGGGSTSGRGPSGPTTRGP
ncbi:S9 family peptidase, partial [Streptomyces fradiae]